MTKQFVKLLTADDAAGIRGGGRHPLDLPPEQHPRTAFEGDPGLCSPRAQHLVSASGAHGGEDMRTADEGRRTGGKCEIKPGGNLQVLPAWMIMHLTIYFKNSGTTGKIDTVMLISPSYFVIRHFGHVSPNLTFCISPFREL